MLLQFSCSNYKSIKEKIDFSMRASSDTSMLERTKAYNGTRVLRMAAIYGANGSGKSNFISAIGFVQWLIGSSIRYQPGEKIRLHPHKLSSEEMPSSFDVQFVIEDVRYAYGFSILRGEISEEYLYHFPKQKQSKIFERNGLKISSGRAYQKSFANAMGELKENRLFLSCAANSTKVAPIEKVFIFFQNDIVIYRTTLGQTSINFRLEPSIERLHENPTLKEAFIRALTYLGTGIQGVDTEVKTADLEEVKKRASDPEVHKQLDMIQKKFGNSFKSVNAQIAYGKFATDLMSEESTGIKKLFQIICPIIDILNSGRILICDELETGLHENIVTQLIKLFYANAPEKFAQLIFTTHDTNLLDLELFRRDQIWFTELNEDRATDLYSLVELRNVRKNENVSVRYIEGKYGAIPMLNEELINSVIESDVTV